jgi:hypothetical protein
MNKKRKRRKGEESKRKYNEQGKKMNKRKKGEESKKKKW